MPGLPWATPATIARGLKPSPDHYDSAWKLVIEFLLRPFLELFFKAIADGVDWSVRPEFLDGQLQSIMPEGSPGEMRADKLVRVGLLGGGSAVLLVHVEVQAQRDPDLARRMFRYHYRLFDKFGHPAASLVVLADDEPGWKPGAYEHETGMSRLRFEYATCKLRELDLWPWIAAGNPVARVVQAHRIAQRTRGDMAARRKAKLALVKELMEAGLGGEDARQVMRVVHWLLALPSEEEVVFMKEFKESLEENMQDKERSPYETLVWEAGVEEGRRLGRDEGWQEGRQEGREEGRQEGRQEGRLLERRVAARDFLLDVLTTRFGQCDASLVQEIEAVLDADRLRGLAQRALRVASLSEFRSTLSGPV